MPDRRRIEDPNPDAGDIPDPNPDKVEGSSITFYGRDITGEKEDLREELTAAADPFGTYAEMREENKGQHDEVLKKFDEEINKAAEGIENIRAQQFEGNLNLALDESGLLVSEIPEVAPPEIQDLPEPEAAEKAPDPPENPSDPGGDSESPEPDPMVEGTVIKATCWTTLDAAADTAETFATKLKESIENGDFDTEDVPYVPNFNGGDFVVGYDANDHLVVYYLVTVDGDFQKDLSALRTKIGAFTISSEYMGLASTADLEILAVPIYRDHGMREQTITVCEDGEDKNYVMLVRDV